MSTRLNVFVKLLIGALHSAATLWVLGNHWPHALDSRHSLAPSIRRN